MPKVMEQNLEKGAEKHGFKRGSKRWNAYVYGTMNKLGGPEKVFDGVKMIKLPGFTHEIPHAHPNVNGVHIGVTVVLILLLWYFVFGGHRPLSAVPSPAQVNPNVPTVPYPGTQTGVGTYSDTSGWLSVQYNAWGANAGATNAESD